MTFFFFCDSDLGVSTIPNRQKSDYLEDGIEGIMGTINPMFPHVFSIELFGFYLISQDPRLKDLFVAIKQRKVTQEMIDLIDLSSFPDYFSIKDTDLRIVIQKFMGDPNYRILTHKDGKLMFRTLPNNEAVIIARSIISDCMTKYEMKNPRLKEDVVFAQERQTEIEKRFNEVRKDYATLECYPIEPFDIEDNRKKDKLKQKLYGTNPSLMKD